MADDSMIMSIDDGVNRLVQIALAKEAASLMLVAERLRYMASSVPPEEMADECNRLARFLEDHCVAKEK